MYFVYCILGLIGLCSASTLVQAAKPGQVSTNFGLRLPEEQIRILDDVSWRLRISLLKDYKPQQNDDENGIRAVEVQALMLPEGRRQNEEKRSADEAECDDLNMKMKLIRLMYERVRDSDLRVKEVELIKKHYTNSTAFEVGYLIGDITDKFNIMSDISMTLKRLYRDWKSIEHINAYEQIANLGIDIGHIIDMIKGAEKRAKGQYQRAEQNAVTKGKNYLQYYVAKQLQAISNKGASTYQPLALGQAQIVMNKNTQKLEQIGTNKKTTARGKPVTKARLLVTHKYDIINYMLTKRHLERSRRREKATEISFLPEDPKYIVKKSTVTPSTSQELFLSDEDFLYTD